MKNFPSILSDRMPPKLDSETKRLNMLVRSSWVKKIDAWRGQQPDVPNLSEAIRRLVELGLEATKKGPKHRS